MARSIDGVVTLARALAVLAVVAVACSPPVDGNTDPVVACSDLAQASCTRLLACSATSFALRFPDMGTCLTLQNNACFLNIPKAGATWTSGATAAYEEGCSVAMLDPSWKCHDFVEYVNAPPACRQTTGTGPAGSTCGIASQCQSGYCRVTPGSLCGTCTPQPNLGDACTNLVTCGREVGCINGVCSQFITTSRARRGRRVVHDERQRRHAVRHGRWDRAVVPLEPRR